MAQPKRKNEWEAELRPLAIAGNGDRAIPTPSPARALQQLLDEQTATTFATDRWSQRRSLAFIVSISAALWMAILGAAHGVFVAIA